MIVFVAPVSLGAVEAEIIQCSTDILLEPVEYGTEALTRDLPRVLQNAASRTAAVRDLLVCRPVGMTGLLAGPCCRYSYAVEEFRVTVVVGIQRPEGDSFRRGS